MIIQIQQTSLVFLAVTVAILWLFKPKEGEENPLGNSSIIILIAALLSAVIAVFTTLYIIWT